MDTFYPGQIVELKEDLKLKHAFDDFIFSVPKGSKAIVMPDGHARLENGVTFPLADIDDISDLYDLRGIAEWLVNYLDRYFEFENMFKEENDRDMFIAMMTEELRWIGFPSNEDELDYEDNEEEE